MKQPMRRSRWLAVALLIAVYATPSPARADESRHLAEAREALGALRYEQALHALEKALYAGKNDPGSVRSIYRMLGEIHAALGDRNQAERAFRNLLALDPTAELDRGTSPKIARPFASARERIGAQGGIEARCTTDEVRSSVTLDVASDPVDMVAGVRVTYRREGGSEQILESRAGARSVRVPGDERVTLVCAAIDEHGNRLIEIGSWDRPLVLEPPADALTDAAPAAPVERRSPPFYGRWYVWGTAAVLAGGAGGYFAWQVREDQAELDRLNDASADHSFSEAEEIERRGKRNALIANVAFATAGACVIGAVISLLLEPGAPAGERPTALVPLPVERGAGVSVVLSF